MVCNIRSKYSKHSIFDIEKGVHIVVILRESGIHVT